ATAQGQMATYVTERCVVELRDDGLTVTEIAPGVDLQRDILDQAGTTLRVANDLRPMDAALFQPGLIGLKP
ncbi:MAG: acyl CoA:acetate/3-ketoacid CoA transferase, partial [Paracoccaceae bacterium]|nr:acyl CoA:acetate/3-ketoacid CoA transferase [Paracoccaceae bacterium]